MNISLNITNIEVMTRKQNDVSLIGTSDLVIITTDLPSPIKTDEFNKGPLTLTFLIPTGKGIEYVKDNFGIDPVIIER